MCVKLGSMVSKVRAEVWVFYLASFQDLGDDIVAWIFRHGLIPRVGWVQDGAPFHAEA